MQMINLINYIFIDGHILMMVSWRTKKHSLDWACHILLQKISLSIE